MPRRTKTNTRTGVETKTKSRAKPPKKLPLRDILYGLALSILVCAIIFLVEIAVLLILRNLVDLNLPLWSAVYQALIYIIALSLLLLAPKYLKRLAPFKTSREELGLRGLPTWTDLGLAPIGFIAYFLLAAALSALFTIFPWFNLTETQDVGFNNLFSSSDRLIAFFALVIVAPIAEEIIFRGFLYGKLRNRLNVIPAALIVSIAFGAMHGQWNVGVNVFTLSLVLCALREITGTTYSGILLHMLKNGLAFYMLYVIV